MFDTATILIVDDDDINLDLLEAMLTANGYGVVRARSGREALDRLSSDIDLVILDLMMPDIDGFAVAMHIRSDSRFHDMPIIAATASSAMNDRLRAVECGANDYINKPIDRFELRVRTLSMLKMKAAQDAVKRHQSELEHIIDERTAELRSAIQSVRAASQKIREAHFDTVRRLAIAAEHRDEDTAAHLQRVAEYCAILAEGCDLELDQIELIRHASLLHDVGKIGVPDSVLLKPGPLTVEEFEVVRQHTLIGGSILSDSVSPLIQAGESIALSHHEKWDGSGYPNGLAGEEIPLFGRICAISDVFDALLSRRPYKEPFTMDQTLDIMSAGRGKHFDPAILDVFFDHLDEILAIRDGGVSMFDPRRRGSNMPLVV